MADKVTLDLKGLKQTLQNIEKWHRKADKLSEDALKQVGFAIETDAKRGVPVQYGTLKNSITTNWSKSNIDHSSVEGVSKPVSGKDEFIVAVGTKVKYACIFDANTRIKTTQGHSTIGQIKKGDYVISQDGKEHQVTKTHKFSALEKPDLVKLSVKWRKDRNHTIIITNDHKILAYKNNTSYWIKAGDLKVGDMVFMPKKISPAKGTGKKRICLNCGKEYSYQSTGSVNNKYCCDACKLEHWNKGHNPNIGSRRSKKTRKLQSKKKKEFLKKYPKKHVNILTAKADFKSKNEKQIEKWLNEIGVDYIPQFNVGTHYVDFAVPSEKLLLEADGAYWHHNQIKDISRDIELKRELPDWSIIHFHFTDRKFSRDIISNPLEDVYYLQCNNSMNSYVNLKFFTPTPILKIDKFNFKNTPVKPHGTKKKAFLYDLSVEDVHSFIANGILVSNSMQEFGSWGDAPKTGKGEYPSKKGRKHVPKHRPAKGFLYLTRAYLKNRNKAKAQIAKELRKIT